MTPLKRLYNLLSLDKKDVYQIIFYAIFAGLISLSLPLGIQAIINFIQSGRISASWIVLIILVVLGVALVGILSLMQLRITENLQQKIFIRSSFEFVTRLPKIKQKELYGTYTPDLSNRFFDTLTIQKGISKLLVDFSAALLQIAFGIILLSLYHPFFIIFGVLLLALLYFIFKFSHKKGLESSLNESKYKYKTASWLQEIARNNTSFRTLISHNFALYKNDRIVNEYLKYREKHFGIIKNQHIQLIVFKILITTCLLSVGGYFVLQQQMNIGQFVAAEIIILLVINSVEKIIIGLETFYDVLTALEKIGQVCDMPMEKTEDNNPEEYKNITLEATNVSFKYPDSDQEFLSKINLKIEQGEKILINGKNGAGKSILMRILSGLELPTSGSFAINDDSLRKINLNQYRSKIATVTQGETPFEGTILENITFNAIIDHEKLNWAIQTVDLSNYIKSLPNGLDTHLISDGQQLSASNAQKILLARSIINQPKILILEDPTDKMDDEIAKFVIDTLTSNSHNWTIIVSSKNEYWAEKCNRIITLNDGMITNNVKQ